MMRSLIAALLMFCCFSSARAEWKLIDVKDGQAFYINDFFRPGGDTTRMWMLIEYREPTPQGSLSVTLLWEVDCASRAMRTLRYSSFPYRMGIGDAIKVDETPSEWIKPDEDSPQETMFVLICRFDPNAGPKT
jgi:hypothetical protein